MAQSGIYLPWCLPTAMGEHCTCCSPQKRDNLGQREPVPEGNGIWLHWGRVGEPGLALMRKSSGGVPTLCCQWMGEGDGGGKMLRVSRRCWHRAGINWEPCISWTLVSLCAPTMALMLSLLQAGNLTSNFFFPRDKTTQTHMERFCFLAQLPSTLLTVTLSPGNMAWLLQHSHLNASQPVLCRPRAESGEVPAVLVMGTGLQGSFLSCLSSESQGFTLPCTQIVFPLLPRS